MGTYKIVSHNVNGLPLNVYGSGTITGRRNVCIWTDTGSVDQQWSIASLISNQLVRSMNNTNYALNANRSTWNCDVYTANSDSYVNFLSLGSNVYRIQLKSDTSKYLTATGTASNADVKWQALNSSSTAQKWKVTAVGGGSGGTSKVLTIPSSRVCCWNQFYSGITTAIGSTKGCTITTALDLVNFYGPSSYTIENIKGAWGSGGMNWSYSFPGNLRVKGAREDLTGSAAFSAIRSEINAGHPVIVNIGTSSANHTVMCYGYTNGGTENAHFKVMDPAYWEDKSRKTGLDTTLDVSMTRNSHPQGIWSIRRTYSA